MPDFINNRYRIIQPLGEGGMAIVYLAHDESLNRQVALKMVRIGDIAPNQLPLMLERFQREAEALGQFSSTEGIINVFDYGEFDGQPYLVMEYMPGGTLKERLEEPIPYPQATSLILPILNALEAIHQAGFIHRDIKPSNILLSNNDEFVLADFGIAKNLDKSEHTLTKTGLGIGTLAYMAPEQWRGTATQQSDIYSLGVVFYEMITGQKPFKDRVDTDLYLQVMTKPIPDPRTYVKKLPRKLITLLNKAIHRDPEKRYATMSEFKKDLLDLLRRHSITTRTKLAKKSDDESLISNLPSTSSESQTVDQISSQSISLKSEPLHTRKRFFTRSRIIVLAIILATVSLALTILFSSPDNIFEIALAPSSSSTIEETQPPSKTATGIPPSQTLTSSQTSTATLQPSLTMTPTIRPTRPSPTPSPTVPVPNYVIDFLPEASFTSLLHMDFENTKVLPGFWDPEWEVVEVEGNSLMQAISVPSNGFAKIPTAIFGNQFWENYVFKFRYQVTECSTANFFGCVVVTVFRHYQDQCYVLKLNTAESSSQLEFGGKSGWVPFEVGSMPVYTDLAVNTWHEVVIIVNNDQIFVAIDGDWKNQTEDDRLPSGPVHIEVGAGTTALFDDFQVWKIQNP